MGEDRAAARGTKGRQRGMVLGTGQRALSAPAGGLKQIDVYVWPRNGYWWQQFSLKFFKLHFKKWW